MKRASSVFLRTDITVQDAYAIIDWLENKKVTRYLNESPEAAEHIRRLLERSCSPILTAAFNHMGRFFIVSTKGGKPIGFVKLVSHSREEVEIVVVIGDDRIWGRGYGRKAVKASLQMVFFEWRAESVIANIHAENRHSIHLFEKIGLQKEKEGLNSIRYRITLEQFVSSLQSATLKVS